MLKKIFIFLLNISGSMMRDHPLTPGKKTYHLHIILCFLMFCGTYYIFLTVDNVSYVSLW